jgi:hypothetical protein
MKKNESLKIIVKAFALSALAMFLPTSFASAQSQLEIIQYNIPCYMTHWESGNGNSAYYASKQVERTCSVSMYFGAYDESTNSINEDSAIFTTGSCKIKPGQQSCYIDVKRLDVPSNYLPFKGETHTDRSELEVQLGCLNYPNYPKVRPYLRKLGNTVVGRLSVIHYFTCSTPS